MPIDNSVPKFFNIEKSEISLTSGFITYEDAGKTYDEAGFTYDGITGSSGNPPKL